jgi:hypothetical protein
MLVMVCEGAVVYEPFVAISLPIPSDNIASLTSRASASERVVVHSLPLILGFVVSRHLDKLVSILAAEYVPGAGFVNVEMSHAVVQMADTPAPSVTAFLLAMVKLFQPVLVSVFEVRQGTKAVFCTEMSHLSSHDESVQIRVPQYAVLAPRARS